MPIGPLEVVVIVVIALLVFGAKRIPETGRNLGRGMRQFKEGITGEALDEQDRGEADAPAKN